MLLFLGENSGFSSVRLCASGPRGRWFKSSRSDFFATSSLVASCDSDWRLDLNFSFQAPDVTGFAERFVASARRRAK